ncbi:deoxyribonuclease NucA/NucB-domain-containing protein [Delphinella strobiligena]|nr:deoxyribonuclease NucA/NucB-domain-containing protein [Delphinella strobiligena]
MRQSLLFLSLCLQSVFAATIPTKTFDSGPLQKRASDDILMFDCSKLPEVCSNMCYGSYCLSNGASLTYDDPPAATSSARRTAAGCMPNPNRCSTINGYAEGYNCDEFPFASVELSGGGTATRVNRCVPSSQNSVQGGTIASFFKGDYCNGGPCTFTLGFENSDGLLYCDADNGGSCKNDGNEVIGPNDPAAKLKRSPSLSPPPISSYALSSGSTVVVPVGASPGQRAWRVAPVNETLWLSQSEGHVLDGDRGHEQFEYMLANLYLVEDSIVGVANTSVAV